MPKAPFPIQPELTAIAIGYIHAQTIADQVLPMTPVGVDTFKYLVYDNEDRFTIPDTRIGRTSEANVVEFGATETEASTEDYALDDYIPQKDLDNAPPNYNPLGNATEGIMQLVKLDREVRTKDLVFDANQYAAANKEDITGTKFNVDTTDPIEIIESAKDSMLIQPTQVTLGYDVFSALRRNPNVVKAVHRTAGDKGIATKAQLEDLFEMIFVIGRAFHQTAKKGQAPVYSKVWTNHMLMQHVDTSANTSRGITFGLTARHGTPVGGSQFDPKRGLKGSHWVRAGESVKELIVAPELGYLFQNAV